MRLVVVRHGPAESRDPSKWPDDDRRPLSREGRESTREAATGIARLEPKARTIVTSPATRARSTALILREALDSAPIPAEWRALEPGAPAAGLLERLAHHHAPGETVILVGHEPQLGELVGLALTGDAVSVTRLARAGAAAFTFPKAIRAGAATLDWRLDRRDLARLGK
ncbi:MAG: histidine phosphatase family protein [Thermoplasmata archaeon]|nr:histidine phosphatase family protein [Thermoplasmata archaeon]MCI4361863.1 histidine phosphatase family protein [Thermoplasmata archaeon]